MKKALIHDWYTAFGGGEKVAADIADIWGDFEFFTLVESLDAKTRQKIFKENKVNTSFIQKLPFGKKKYRNYLSFFPIAIEQFDVSEFELVISSSSSVAKGVLTHQNQLHICYCHSPMRYAWDLYFNYLKEANLESGLKSMYARHVLHKIRQWDIVSSNRVDYFIANSNYIAKRIKKVYNRESIVIYPPVDTESFVVSKEKADYYITYSRMVAYKKIDLIVKAFSKTNKKLIVIGDGPDLKKIRKLSSPNVQVLGFTEKSKMIDILSKARAFIFASEEDFGIAPVEAQACGVPVIAFGKGGALETIKGVFTDEDISTDKTGVFFKHQNENSLLEAIAYFEKHENSFNKDIIRENALRFGVDRFKNEFKETVQEIYKNWKEHN